MPDPISSHPPFATVFSASLELGTCLGVALPIHDHLAVRETLSTLPEGERALAARFASRRLSTFVGGRVAMHRLLEERGQRLHAILRNDRGAPILPVGVAGSISHKQDLAVAFIAHSAHAVAGVDIETRLERTQDVAAHILRDEERDRLGRISSLSEREEVLLRFSAKEALYKILDPRLRRFIGFKEVSVDPAADGGIAVSLFLETGTPPPNLTLRWNTSFDLAYGGIPFFLSTAVAG